MSSISNGSDQAGSRTKQRAGMEKAVSRRRFLAGVAGGAAVAAVAPSRALGEVTGAASLNLARVAVPTSLRMTSENKITSLNDGFTPVNSSDRDHGLFAVYRDEQSEAPQGWVQ